MIGLPRGYLLFSCTESGTASWFWVSDTQFTVGGYLAKVRLTDDDLVAPITRKEPWALAELYDRYARLVFSLALRMLGDGTSAEETVQEVFAKVWRGASDHAPEDGGLSLWLVGLTRQHCLDELRRRPPSPRAQSRDPDSGRELNAEDGHVGADECSCEQERVRRALAQIPTEQRRVIELAFFHGLTHREIADLCKESLSTVKTHVRLGMQKLRDRLRE